VTQEKNLIAGTVGLGVAVGTSFIATPAVGAGVGAAAGTVTSLVLEQFSKDSEPEFRKELGSDIAERWENTRDAHTAMSHNAAVRQPTRIGHRMPIRWRSGLVWVPRTVSTTRRPPSHGEGP
jgi:hypothetical protein